MSVLGWIGRMAKAEVRDGKPFLQYLVTGPELDKQTERATKAIGEKVMALAKAGRVFLAPSHDTPLQLAKSTDACMDDAGHTFVEFEMDPADPMSMKVFKGYESGDWTPTVSLGAEKVTRRKVFDEGLGKSITEIVDLDDSQPVHVALAFPGRNVYPLAGVTGAFRKAVLDKDGADLAKRGWPLDRIEKAIAGAWDIPSFGERWAASQLMEDMPGMMDVLRYTVEDVMSPYSGAADKRGAVTTAVQEFLDAALGAAKASETPPEGITKSEGDPAPIPEPENVPPASPQADTGDIPPEPIPSPQPPPSGADTASENAVLELGKAVSSLTASVTEVQGTVKVLQERMEKAMAPPPVPAMPDTDPASAPHTGLGLAPAGSGKDAAAIKSLEDEADSLRKAIDSEGNANRRAALISQHGDVIVKLARLTN
jgi:hypothetical protein